MLTPELVQSLYAPFPPEYHDFRHQAGVAFAYITEYAICLRLAEVDPQWSFSIISIARDSSTVYCHGRLTLCGVSRDGIGQDSISKTPDGRETNEAFKAAATDALKRAARLFGVGAYLLHKPDWVTTPQDLARWLSSSPDADPPAPKAQALQQPADDDVPFIDTKTLSIKRTKTNKLYAVAGNVSIFKLDQVEHVVGRAFSDEGDYKLDRPLRVYYTQGEKYLQFVRCELAPPKDDKPLMEASAALIKTDAAAQALVRRALEGRDAKAILDNLGLSAFSDFSGSIGQLVDRIASDGLPF